MSKLNHIRADLSQPWYQANSVCPNRFWKGWSHEPVVRGLYLLVLGVSLKVSGSVLHVSESKFWNQEIVVCGERKRWVTCIAQHANILSKYCILIMSICKGYFAPPVSTFFFKVSWHKPLKWLTYCHLYFCKQPPIMTHWFMKLGSHIVGSCLPHGDKTWKSPLHNSINFMVKTCFKVRFRSSFGLSK